MTIPFDKLLEANNEEDQEVILPHSTVEEVEDSSESQLYNLLLNHAITLYSSGTSIDDVEKFLSNRGEVEGFFKERGHAFPEKIETPVNTKEGEEDGSSGSDGSYTSDDDDDEHEEGDDGEKSSTGSSRTSTLLRYGIYLIFLTVIALCGHIGICHLLDVNPLLYFPSLQEKRCLLPAHPILMEMTRPVADCGFCNDQKLETAAENGSNSIIIEMKDTPQKTEFAKVAYLSKPVIIRGGGKTGGMPTGFNFHNLKEIFQSEPGGVDAVSEECQFLPFRSPFTSLREAFEKISENSTWDEPWYIGWSNCHPGVAAKLRELFPRPDFLPDDSSSSAIDWIFIGSPGLGASMHIDYVKRPSWQAQLSGVKRWILHPPPECESVCPESVTFTIYPGDLLFLETNTWYHETFIDSDSLSISIGSEYD